MIDIVLDTCTLVHASNPKSKYQQDSIDLVNKMFENSVHITVDEGFTLDEATNQSYIGFEYISHLMPGSIGFSLIQELALSGRISFVSNKVPRQVKNRVEQIIRNKKDRLFLRVAINSQERLLVSHDYTDYQIQKRKTIRKELDVMVVEAKDVNNQL